ncbi:MAG TPA: hypothetical protein VEX15_12970 [Nocardioidaceae bacterium]|nr:hypothetical protein [Nocardioidaceae bacterium]
MARLGYQYSIGPEIALELAAVFETEHPRSGVVLTTLNEVFDFTSVHNGHVNVQLTWSPGGSAHAALADDLTAGPVLGSDQREILVAKTTH